MLWTCGASADTTLEPYQHWSYNAGQQKLSIVTAESASLWGSQWCPQTNGPAVPNATVWSQPCGGTPKTSFTVGTASSIKFTDANLCLDIQEGQAAVPGSVTMLAPCVAGAASQLWTLNPSTGRVVHQGSGLCLDSGSHHAPCAPGGLGSDLPFCNASLPVDARVADLVSRMTTLEKIGLLDTSAAGAPRLGVAPVQVWNEALHGVANNVGVAYLDPIKASTSFPMPILTSCAFNRTLWHAIGATISTEARAFANAGHAGLTYWAPTMNVFRDPRWGRGQETPGEDVTVTSAYVTNFVQGMQNGPDPRYLKVSACIKHYAGYSLELWNGTDRHHFNAVINDADLVDYYLPAFQAGVEVGKTSAVMCSYNAVNGVPSCANEFLINQLMRKQWGLDAYVTSDCGAVTDIPDNHHYPSANPNPSAVVASVLKAGTDIGCDDYLVQAGLVETALADGSIAQTDLDSAVSHLLRVRFRLGEFDAPEAQPYTKYGPSDVCTADSIALATDAARQGIVLLHNLQGALPLSRSAVKTVALIGPSGNISYTNGGPNYNGLPCTGINTVLDALNAQSGLGVNFVEGCNGVSCNSADGFPAAVAAAGTADATIVAVGIDQTYENEGLDRNFLGLPGQQAALASQACAAAAAKGSPCVLVVLSGGAIDIGPVLATGNVSGAFYAGLLGGTGAFAFVDIVFGAAAPAGRMTQTTYADAFTTEVSLFEMGVRPGPSVWPPGTTPGRTYQWYTGQSVLFPFGFGLSYTQWRVSAVSGPAQLPLAPVEAYLSRHADSAAGAAAFPSMVDEPTAATYSVNVTNVGSVDSDYVVLGFVVPPGAGTGGVPLQTLFGFDRVHVPAGETATVWLGLGARHLTRVLDVDTPASEQRAGVPTVRRVAQSGQYTVRFGLKPAAAAAAEGVATAPEGEWAERVVLVV